MILPLILLSSSFALTYGESEPVSDMLCEDKYKNGERFQSGNFIKECKSNSGGWAISIAACLTPEKKEITVGSSVVEGRFEYKCLKQENGSVRLEYGPCTSPRPVVDVTPVTVETKKALLCKDKYKNGERYADGNFMMLCTSDESTSRVTIVACLTPEKKEIAIGSSTVEGRFDYKCTKTEKGASLQYVPCATARPPVGPTVRPLLKCDDKYENGQKFNEGNFVKQCQSTDSKWAIIIFGCLTPSKKEIALGAEEKENGWIYSCMRKGENGATLQSRSEETTKKTAKCDDKYENGEKFTVGNFVKQCIVKEDRTLIVAVACLTPLKKEFAIGETVYEGTCSYTCSKTEKGTEIIVGPGAGETPLELTLATQETENEVEPVTEETKKEFLCEDKYKNGERFPSGNFIKECKADADGWAIVIAACQTPEKKEIAIGSSVVEGPFEYKCIKTDKGAKVEYVPCGSSRPPVGPTVRPTRKCEDKYENGERFAEGNFMRLCTADEFTTRVTTVACLTPKLKKEFAIGEKIEEDNCSYTCVKTENGAKIVGPPKTEVKEEDLLCQGKYKNGEKFKNGAFLKICKSSPSYTLTSVIACISNNNTEVKIGESVQEGQMIFKCIKTENGAKIETDFVNSK